MLTSQNIASIYRRRAIHAALRQSPTCSRRPPWLRPARSGCGGYKNTEGKGTPGPSRPHRTRRRCRARHLRADYDEHRPTAPRSAPALHAGTLNRVLRKLADYPRRLGELGAILCHRDVAEKMQQRTAQSAPPPATTRFPRSVRVGAVRSALFLATVKNPGPLCRPTVTTMCWIWKVCPTPTCPQHYHPSPTVRE